MKEVRIAFVTVPDYETGIKIAKDIVSKKLAACVNVVKEVSSFYIWDNEMQEDKESLLIIKTTADVFNIMMEEIKKHHPYTVPEIISVGVEEGNKEYIEWVIQQCKGF